MKRQKEHLPESITRSLLKKQGLKGLFEIKSEFDGNGAQYLMSLCFSVFSGQRNWPEL